MVRIRNLILFLSFVIIEVVAVLKTLITILARVKLCLNMKFQVIFDMAMANSAISSQVKMM